MIANISLNCPPMTISKVDRNHRRTAAEPMTATIRLPSGVVIVIPSVVIPETIVRKTNLLSWLVDPCIGKGQTLEADLTVILPAERTSWSWSDFTMVAEAIGAATFLKFAGQTWSGNTFFPRCRISGLLSDVQTAEAVLATGTLTLQE